MDDQQQPTEAEPGLPFSETKVDALMLAANVELGVAEATSVWNWEASGDHRVRAPNGWSVRIVTDGRLLWNYPMGTPVFLGRDFFLMRDYAVAAGMLQSQRLRLHYWDQPDVSGGGVAADVERGAQS